jgi:hypothetical protein
MKYFGCDGSGEITASKSICSGPGFLTSLMVYTDGTNDVEVTLYDNASGAIGDILCIIIVAGASDYGGRNWPEGAFRKFKDGVYAVVSGTGASAIVEYLKS